MTYAMRQSDFQESYAIRSRTDEAAIVQAARGGDLESFNTLVLRHQDRVYNLVYRILGNEQVADDAAQEAFILAYRHIRRFDTGSFIAWLYWIAANVCYDMLRYHKRRPAVSLTRLLHTDDNEERELDLPFNEDGPEATVQRNELAMLLQRHISALPIDQRMVLVLSDVQGLTDKESAGLMRTSIGIVKSRLSCARATMRRSLNGVSPN